MSCLKHDMKGKFGSIVLCLLLIGINLIVTVQFAETKQFDNITTSSLPESKSLLKSANMLSLNGTRFNDSNSNGIMDDGEKGLAGAKIRLMQNGTEISFTVVNDYGRYSFNNLRPGQYSVVAEMAEGWNLTSPANGLYDVTLIDKPISHLDFGDNLANPSFAETKHFDNNTASSLPELKSLLKLANMLSLNGTMFNDSNSNGIMDDGEKGLAGAKIRLMQNGTDISFTVSNDYGHYFFNNLSPGQYSVAEEKAEGWNLTSPANGLYDVTLIDKPISHLDFGVTQTNPLYMVRYKPLQNLSKDWVITPFGPRLRSNVHEMKQGDIIAMKNGSLQEISPSGEVIYKFVGNTTGGENMSLTSGNISISPSASGWIADASWTKNGGDPAIDSFTTSWIVPPDPTTQSSQVIFLFNGIQNWNPAHILQPVLQWGNNGEIGGNYWVVASWYVGGDAAIHTTPVRVDVGDNLVGLITHTGTSQAGYNYNCQFQGISGTSLPVQNIRELTYFVETLEAYGITKCFDYPATDITAFNGIGIQAGSAYPSIEWTPWKQVTDCGRQYAEVNSNSNPGGEVDIHYGRDSFGYQVTDSNYPGGPTYNWIEISGTGTEVLPDSDDSHISNIPLGFLFAFYGINYDQMTLSNNGLLFCGTGSDQWTNERIKQSTAHGFIAPFWDDLVTRNGGKIYYQTIGTAPNREFIVEWYDNQHFSSSTSGVTFEVILYEGSNNIQFQYLDTTFGSSSWDGGLSATVGIENPDGTDGLQYSYNMAGITPNLAILFKCPQSYSRLMSFARGSDADGNLWYRKWDGASWGGWVGLGGPITLLDTASVGSNLFAFARGSNTDGNLWYRKWDGSSWGGWQSLGGPVTLIDTVSVGSNLYTFARGSTAAGNQLWYRKWDGTSWGGWVGLGGPVTLIDAASVGSNLFVFARGSDADGNLWYRKWDGTSWGGWVGLGGPVTLIDTVSVGSNLYAFARGSTAAGNQLWYRKWDGTSWGGWVGLGGPVTLIDAASVGSNLFVFARGSDADGNLWYRKWDGTSWGGWVGLGGPVTLIDTVSVGSNLYTFARGSTAAGNQLWYRKWDGTSWGGWVGLGGPVTLIDSAPTSF